jgi:DNA polymerase-3 subunit gamma/tau
VGGPQDPAQSVEEREAYAEWAGRLSHAVIHRLWQLLLKGLGEVNTAPLPLEAAEMALLRVIHASELPDPGALLGRIAGGELAPSRSAAPAPPPQSSSAPQAALPSSFTDLVALLDNSKPHLAQQLHDFAGLVRYAPPELVVRLTKPIPDFVRDLAAALKAATGAVWQVSTSDADAQPTLLAQEKASAAAERDWVMNTPVVRAAREAFPEAELTGYRLGEQRR